DPGGREDPVVLLQGLDQALPLLLRLLLGTHEQEVEQQEDRAQDDERRQRAFGPRGGCRGGRGRDGLGGRVAGRRGGRGGGRRRGGRFLCGGGRGLREQERGEQERPGHEWRSRRSWDGHSREGKS